MAIKKKKPILPNTTPEYSVSVPNSRVTLNQPNEIRPPQDFGLPANTPIPTTGSTTRQPTGSYDAKKGGYTTNGGKFYPTSNPNFAPGQLGQTPLHGGYESLADQKKFEPYDTAVAQQQQAQLQLQQQADLLNQPDILMPDGREVVQDGGLVSDTATGAAAAGGAVVGAKAGAALGTLVAPGIGTVIGGIVGGIGGAIGGAYTKLTVQKRQSVKEATKVFSQAKTNKNEILNMVNAGLVTEGQARALWQEEKQNIYSSYTYLKRETDSDLNNFLGQPADELIQVESYLALDRFYDVEFEKALMQPNPNKILNLNPTE